jgi:hypothetical protein
LGGFQVAQVPGKNAVGVTHGLQTIGFNMTQKRLTDQTQEQYSNVNLKSIIDARR